MPKMDGIQFARTVRDDITLRELPLIMYTVLGQAGLSLRAESAGFNGFVNSPAHPEWIRECIVAVLANVHNEGTRRFVNISGVDSSSRKPKVRLLLAEDNVVNQKVALRLLKKLGYSADVVVDGKAALEAARNTAYEAILMDCQMPEMDGYQATRAIRALEGERGNTPIIALTANAMRDDRDKCLNAGMDAYVAKPIEPKALESAIHGVLELGRTEGVIVEGEKTIVPRP